MSQQLIPGYTYGTHEVPRSPVTIEEFELLKQAVLFTDEDARHLQLSEKVLEDQVEAVLDVWYGFIGSLPQLLYYFTRPDGQADGAYLAAVRKRFAQWIRDTARANYDQSWLDYQYEIGLRHHRTGKNTTDHVNSVANIGFRYLFPLIFPVTITLKPFLAKKGHSAEVVEKMQQAWVKSLLLQITLWSQPYIKPGDF
ncbi:protogloblin ApPgb [Ktedonosporobacter rubrisoli]|uniref:Protogloblin ApPgb n=1 Tax=Ktedonosporobacter rubrisoli TaxID=2509675 RepID=A0A4P6JZG6_KTERU|nr:protoglobin domain-containing protein [Ktedonosporobacter rubrisoli]QBD81005.1 protogloblin ApPgb [Ktedonosporobacter rubrisoli]